MRDDIWQPLRYFEGNWTGTGRGEPGTATVKRDYSFMLSGRYLQVRSESKWEPTEKNPEGEVHTEMGMFSYDKARKLFVLRVFHVESFVNQYVQDTQPPKGLICVLCLKLSKIFPPVGAPAKATVFLVRMNSLKLSS